MCANLLIGSVSSSGCDSDRRWECCGCGSPRIGCSSGSLPLPFEVFSFVEEVIGQLVVKRDLVML